MNNNYLEISPSRAKLVSEKTGDRLREMTVVEFGASSGQTLRDLQSKYACDVYAFDKFPVDLDFCESVYFDLDELDFEPIKGQLERCDLVLFLDVLEHLKDPREVINRLCMTNQHLEVMMVSPNFTSVRMLAAWISGAMPERQSGFFDGTHLKWLSPKWIHTAFPGSAFEVEHFYVFSEKAAFRFLQKLAPSRLCSQFGAIIKQRAGN